MPNDTRYCVIHSVVPRVVLVYQRRIENIPVCVGLLSTMDPQGFVALFPPAPARAPTARGPKGLSVYPRYVGTANSPAPDEPRPDATNPRATTELLVSERGLMGEGRVDPSGRPLADDRGRPWPG